MSGKRAFHTFTSRVPGSHVVELPRTTIHDERHTLATGIAGRISCQSCETRQRRFLSHREQIAPLLHTVPACVESHLTCIRQLFIRNRRGSELTSPFPFFHVCRKKSPGAMDCFIIRTGGYPIVSLGLPGAQRHYSYQTRAARSPPVFMEQRIRTAMLGNDLRPNLVRRQNGIAAGASGLSAYHGAGLHLPITLRLEYIQFDLWGHIRRPVDPALQRHLLVGLPAQPERPHQWNLCTAVRRFAAHRTRP